VDEWTSADTGVGAAIAAGNHAENGIWALLVQADRVKIIMISGLYTSLKSLINKKVQSPDETNSPIVSRIPTSPKRFVKAVIIPALYDLFL